MSENCPIGARWTARGPLVMVYVFAGVTHLRSPEFFLPIVPGWVPQPEFVVLVTGVCEIAGSAALLTCSFRKFAGIMLALYAVCVYPANIKHALEDVAVGGAHLSWWYHGPRLALQPVFVWWALYAGAVIDWPFKWRGNKT